MTRKQALNYIRVEVALHGEHTRESLRAYVEHRISRQAFDEAARKGLAQHQASQARKAQEAK